MIVKNESSVIRRCIDSVVPFIDTWVIVDTGSTDGTQKVIIEHMEKLGIPGTLHERPWVNFEHNRNQALNLAKGEADYLLFIDADEYFVYEPDFKLPKLDKDYYYIDIDHSGSKWNRITLINTKNFWEWQGVLHEVLTPKPTMTFGTLKNVRNNCTSEGARSKDPDKYLKDAAVLEKALKNDPLNARYVFYLAQSYRDAGDPEKAISLYKKRIALGGWKEEVFFSLLQVAVQMEKVGRSAHDIKEAYFAAFQERPSRIEPLYYLANFLNKQKDFERAYQVSVIGETLPATKDILFQQPWMQEYGILLQKSIAAYWTDRYQESKEASEKILALTNLPNNYRECAERNLGFANAKLIELIVDNQTSASTSVQQ